MDKRELTEISQFFVEKYWHREAFCFSISFPVPQGAGESDKQTEVELLSSFQEKTEKEKKRIEKDLERCKKDAGVTAEEIAAAGQLKAEVEKSGFNL